MTYTGHMHNGQVVFDGPPPPDGAKIQVELLPVVRTIPTLAERLKGVIGTAVDLPPDAARNHDKYIAEAARPS